MQTFFENENKIGPVTTKKLFDAIIKLNHQQQAQVLSYVGEMLSKEKSVAEDQRKSGRKLCDISVNYAAENRIFSDKIKDISKNGLFIESGRPLNVGEEVALSFMLQGYDRPFKVKGKIVRSNQLGFGLEFREIKPYIAEMLGALIERMNE